MRRLLIVLALIALVAPGGAFGSRVRTAIFFYPWYSNPSHDGTYTHWQQGQHTPPFDVSSAFYPARGAYSSSDPRVLDAQMSDIRRARVEEVVSSWWGWGSREDARLPAIVAAARRHHLKVAIQLEPYPGRTVASVGNDLTHLRQLGIRDVFVYRADDFSADEWAALTLHLSGVRTFAQTGHVGFAARAGFTGFYTYDIVVYGGNKFMRMCAQAHAVKLLCAPSVGPGYDASFATGDSLEKPRDNGATYDRMWRAALSAGADLVTITSYNEWSEGTQIEPAGRRGGYQTYDGAYGLHGARAEFAYLDATRRWTDAFRPRR
jgi:glycoprotein endo-alpha-1,2-mannosidase